MMMPSRILWVTDPWHTLNHPFDTTLRLVEEALARGIESVWSDVRSIRRTISGTELTARTVLSVRRHQNSLEVKFSDAFEARPGDFRWIMYRPDPPVDAAYTMPLQLLRAEQTATEGIGFEIVNPVDALLGLSEKIECCAFRGFTPETIISSEWKTLGDFGARLQITVVKPLNDAQGHGVERLDWSDQMKTLRARDILERLTGGFRRPVVLQQYLDVEHCGEVRLWFAGSVMIGSVRKVPSQGTFVINTDRGARIEAHTLTSGERTIADVIGQHLLQRGIRLAAVDLIDGRVTDCNFTSPGLIVEMERVTGRNLASSVVASICSGSGAQDN